EEGDIDLEPFVSQHLAGAGERIGVAAVQKHAGPRVCETSRDRESETAVRARHERNATIQVEGMCICRHCVTPATFWAAASRSATIRATRASSASVVSFSRKSSTIK